MCSGASRFALAVAITVLGTFCFLVNFWPKLVIVALIFLRLGFDRHRLLCVFRSVTAGIDALGEVTVRVQDELSKREYIGKAADTDVIHASAEAYLHAVNRLLSNRGQPDKAHPQKDVL